MVSREHFADRSLPKISIAFHLNKDGLLKLPNCKKKTSKMLIFTKKNAKLIIEKKLTSCSLKRTLDLDSAAKISWVSGKH